jgi:hypothetical protein
MRRFRSAAELQYEALESEYEVVRLAVEAQIVPAAKLDRIAPRLQAAAITLGIEKGWVLPDGP